MTGPHQFDLFGDPIPDEPEPEPDTRSYGRRLTERLRDLADQGINPLVGTTGPAGKTCGDCIHRKVHGHHDRTYPKCDLGPDTHGPKTDVRRYWPACHRFQPTT